MSHCTQLSPASLQKKSSDTLDPMESTLTQTPDGRMPYFPQLDGVRAYCILLVIFDHLKSNGHTFTWLNGHLGVDLFFVLSGFLITTLLRREQVFRGFIDLRAFYWRRFFRIAPVYAAVLLLYIALCRMPGQAARWIQLKAGLPYFLTMLNEYAREPSPGTVFTHTWSLGVEEKFYLLWPVLFFVLAKTTRSRWIVVAALFTAVSVPPLLGHTYLARAYFGLLMGCVMGIVLSGPFAPRAFAALRRLPPSLALLIFACGFYAEHIGKALFPIFSSAAVIFLASLLARTSWLSRFHTWPPLMWLGRRSYAMYLVHVLCLNVIETKVQIDSGLQAAIAWTLAVALTAAAAEILYRTVEKPARQFGRRYLARHHEIAAAI